MTRDNMIHREKLLELLLGLHKIAYPFNHNYLLFASPSLKIFLLFSFTVIPTSEFRCLQVLMKCLEELLKCSAFVPV